MSESEQGSLFERNLAAFNARFPVLYERMVKIQEPESRITGSIETNDLNLDLGHTLLYATDAVSFANAQIERFRAVPGRFYMNAPPNPDPPEQKQHLISQALYEYTRNRPVPAIPAHPTPDGGFMMIYGIGLGFHLPILFEEVDARIFIIMEEYIEFLYHTLFLHDWVLMFERLEERGQSLRFTFGPEPGMVAAQVHWYMRGHGFGLIDGSYIFRHYSSLMLDKAYEEFLEKLPLLPISIGFYEDELVMLTNCAANLCKYDFSLLDAKPRTEKDIPAVIIGSGPSLDRSIDLLKRIQGQVVIFSAGTSLRPLLANGIRPDYHCELENSYSSYLQIKDCGERFGGLDGITLIASTTVHPDLPAVFAKRILYFRDSVSSTALWCPDRIGLHGTAPTCTNLALRAALLMCFRQIFLFGVDLGTRDPSQHHSKHSIYLNDAEWQKSHDLDPIKRMSIELPGNFGGKAYTNPILHWARMMMVQGLETFNFAKIYNCSDGLSIPGTMPKLPQTLRLDVPPGRKAVILQRLAREMEFKRAGEMVNAAEMQELRETMDGYYGALLAEIEESRATASGFIPFYDRLGVLLRERGTSRFQPVLRAVHIGMLMMSMQIAYFFVRRVAEDEVPALMIVLFDRLAQVLRELCLTTDAELRKIIATLPDVTPDQLDWHPVHGPVEP